MKHLFTTLALGAAVFAMPALATSHKEAPDMKKAPTTQQSKMGACNKDAEGKKGDERKAFMKECLSAKKATQQDKMKTCNKDASGKKGDERKAFMKTCLSGAAA